MGDLDDPYYAMIGGPHRFRLRATITGVPPESDEEFGHTLYWHLEHGLYYRMIAWWEYRSDTVFDLWIETERGDRHEFVRDIADGLHRHFAECGAPDAALLDLDLELDGDPSDRVREFFSGLRFIEIETEELDRLYRLGPAAVPPLTLRELYNRLDVEDEQVSTKRAAVAAWLEEHGAPCSLVGQLRFARLMPSTP